MDGDEAERFQVEGWRERWPGRGNMSLAFSRSGMPYGGKGKVGVVK